MGLYRETPVYLIGNRGIDIEASGFSTPPVCKRIRSRRDRLCLHRIDLRRLVCVLRMVVAVAVVAEVDVEDVEQFLADQSDRLSARYVAMQRNVLDQAYRWGQRNRLLTWNPAHLAARPSRLGHKQGTVLTIAMVSLIIYLVIDILHAFIDPRVTY